MKMIRRIHISIPFCILIAVLFVLDFGKVFIPTFIAIVIHEMAHILAIRIVGGEIDRIDIKAFGVCVNVPELSYMPYTKEIIIAAAGPIAGLMTAAIASLAAELFDIRVLGYFTGINIFISAINLIPVYPLDGGRIVLSLTLKLLSVRLAYVICYILSILSIGGIFGICAASAVVGNLNPSLVIFSLYLVVCQIKFRLA